jgi:hypothetical protein
MGAWRRRTAGVVPSGFFPIARIATPSTRRSPGLVLVNNLYKRDLVGQGVGNGVGNGVPVSSGTVGLRDDKSENVLDDNVPCHDRFINLDADL